MNRFWLCSCSYSGVGSVIRWIGAVSVVANVGACGDDGATTVGPPVGLGDGSTFVPEAGFFGDAGFGRDVGTLPSTTCTNSDPNHDFDGDGFSSNEGDCNDCDPFINPGAYDFPGNDHDEDCSGTPATDVEIRCDENLQIGSTSPEDAARAIGLCKFTTADKRDWGVIEARFTTADGSGQLDSPLQVGLVPNFGAAQPRAGASLLALSSGVARAPDQPDFTQMDDSFGVSGLFGGKVPPAGFPKNSVGCGGATIFASTVFNQAALELKIRVPTNAKSLSFDSIFYSTEYPEFVCDAFNDFFVALVSPPVSPDGNIVFDSNGDSIGVNAGLLAVCDPATQIASKPKQFACEQGTALLANTGFGKSEYQLSGFFGTINGVGGASTGWLTTIAPSVPGTVVTLRFAIWDTGDPNLDSTVLVDRFAWSVEQPQGPATVAAPELR